VSFDFEGKEKRREREGFVWKELKVTIIYKKSVELSR
jgi:hypothetical protein